jgi:hypothetical protein
MSLDLMVTMWPSFSHFDKFVVDKRLNGVRLNTAMVKGKELEDELKLAKEIQKAVPLYFDIKGRQLRIVEPIILPDRLELILNHSIEVNTPTGVLFKAGEDFCMLKEVRDGKHLIFDGGPEYMVRDGESLHIRDPSLKVLGPTFLPIEIEKIEMAKRAGFDKYFLSYVESQRDIDEFRELVGKDSLIIAKIENQKGLEYVAREYKDQEGLRLVAALGDMYVEVDKPHEITKSLKLIIERDPRALVGSRMLLSIVDGPVPSCADFLQLAWLYDVGYRKMMLCDEICLKEEWLSTAVDAFDHFRNSYAN